MALWGPVLEGIPQQLTGGSPSCRGAAAIGKSSSFCSSPLRASLKIAWSKGNAILHQGFHPMMDDLAVSESSGMELVAPGGLRLTR